MMTDATMQPTQASGHPRPDPKGPLVGLKAIDLGVLAAGPLVGTMLADWGADVIKVEQPGQGDPVRKLGSHDNIPLWWKVGARGKRSIALNLRVEDDRDILRKLLTSADIVIENFTPGVLEGWGLGYEALREINPRLIMLRVSGFGQTGPYANRRAFGRAAQSFSGFASINGFPDRPPVHPGIPVGDYFAGLTGLGSVLAAYIERERSGLGQEIDLAMYEAAFRIMEIIAVTYDQEGRVITREGTSNSYVAPVGTWKTADDKWVSFTASTQPVTRRVFEAMGSPELFEDPRFSTNAARCAHREELDELLGRWVGGLKVRDLVEICDDHGLVYGIEYDMADIFADPHYQARGTIEAVVDKDVGTIRMSTVVPRFGRTPGSIRWTGEDLDESRQEILSDPDWGAVGG